MHGPLEAFEEAAELGLAGVPPAFSDGAPVGASGERTA
jgi:hypothetical protein